MNTLVQMHDFAEMDWNGAMFNSYKMLIKLL